METEAAIEGYLYYVIKFYFQVVARLTQLGKGKPSNFFGGQIAAGFFRRRNRAASCSSQPLRGALNKDIYLKSTPLSVPSCATNNTGQIQNLMATDVFNISESSFDSSSLH